MKRNTIKIESEYNAQDIIDEYSKNHKVDFTFVFLFDRKYACEAIEGILNAKWRDIETDYWDGTFYDYKEPKYIWEIDTNWDEEEFLKGIPKKGDGMVKRILLYFKKYEKKTKL